MSKYTVAKTLLAQLEAQAAEAGIDAEDALEALLVSAIQTFSQQKGGAYAKDFLQYEVDSISAGGVYEVQRR